MADFFFYGTLCHAQLLRVVLGREVGMQPAQLPGHSVFWVKGRAFPVLVEGGTGAKGVVVRGLSEAEVRRLDFYEGGFGYETREVMVPEGALPVHVYFPEPDLWEPGEPWSLSDWVARWGGTVVAAAEDAMRLYGEGLAADAVQRRYPMMLARAGARLRAEAAGAPRVRRAAGKGDLDLRRRWQPYGNFFAVEEYDLRFRRFDGDMSTEVNRAVFISADAAVVLPYDPARDRVLLIEQFRMGPLARGDRQPWLLEAIAGRIDGGETPEAAAHREAMEEAGLVLKSLLPATHYYPSPSAKSEFLYNFVGIADLPDGSAGFGGVPGEVEDIRAHLMPFAELLDLVDKGEITAGPLVILTYWLAARRDALRRGG
ncbi:MAG: gamma-glutamylcyclotransferase [Proteobacteria bacterium]|nr:gamma-glutamylcyclotransferase [Pseudomonadota bacterium]